jgi:hypothetical protein
MKNKTGNELALIAMKKDFVRFSKIADNAEKEVNEWIRLGSEEISIHEEFIKITNLKESTRASLKKLKELGKRSERVNKLKKKNLLRLIDAQNNAEINKDSLGREIQNVEYRLAGV